MVSWLNSTFENIQVLSFCFYKIHVFNELYWVFFILKPFWNVSFKKYKKLIPFFKVLNFRIWPSLKKDIYGIFDVLNKNSSFKSKMIGVILSKASVLHL